MGVGEGDADWPRESGKELEEAALVTENEGGKEAVDISGRGVMWTEWGRHKSGLHTVKWGPSSVLPGESWGCWPLQQL